MEAAKGMEHVDPEEAKELRSETLKVIDGFEHKPYCKLKKLERHRDGALRMWPKWKSLKKIWSGMEEEKGKKEEKKELSIVIEEEEVLSPVIKKVVVPSPVIKKVVVPSPVIKKVVVSSP